MGDNSPFAFNAQITPELISSHPDLIQPRIKKNHPCRLRSKSRAEVFTPAWICNAQNNLVDEQWFGRKDVFNTEYINEEGEHRWLTSKPPIVFPAKRSWMSYVRARRMEITCGEGPYLISRYDATTGRLIPISERIGMLDRKFRIINENTLPSRQRLTNVNGYAKLTKHFSRYMALTVRATTFFLHVSHYSFRSVNTTPNVGIDTHTAMPY